MNSEPCVRFGIRISPKMREKPADSRKSSPPKVMLLTASTSQKFMVAAVPRSPCQRIAGACTAPAQRLALRFERREDAWVNRLSEELLFLLSAETTYRW